MDLHGVVFDLLSEGVLLVLNAVIDSRTFLLFYLTDSFRRNSGSLMCVFEYLSLHTGY